MGSRGNGIFKVLFVSSNLNKKFFASKFIFFIVFAYYILINKLMFDIIYLLMGL